MLLLNETGRREIPLFSYKGADMKKVISLLLAFSIILLSSCESTRTSLDIALSFCEEYPLDATVYSSLATENDKRYIDADVLTLLFGIDQHPVSDYTLVLYGKVSTVRELGVFITRNSDERMKVVELATGRIDFLESFADGEGFIKKYHTVTVYGFVEDASRAEWLLDNLI